MHNIALIGRKKLSVVTKSPFRLANLLDFNSHQKVQQKGTRDLLKCCGKVFGYFDNTVYNFCEFL